MDIYRKTPFISFDQFIYSSTVRLGEHDTSTDTEAVTEDFAVTRVSAHRDFDKKDGNSDIAILYMDRDAAITCKLFIEQMLFPRTAQIPRNFRKYCTVPGKILSL